MKHWCDYECTVIPVSKMMAMDLSWLLLNVAYCFVWHLIELYCSDYIR